jgi:hypothetical protein
MKTGGTRNRIHPPLGPSPRGYAPDPISKKNQNNPDRKAFFPLFFFLSLEDKNKYLIANCEEKDYIVFS